MKRYVKGNQSGFSLVELMVVVAIIGILASVAIPSVNKYMAKARQTEAKTNLASIYSANKAFAVEYSTFGTHFAIIGYAPEGLLRYNVGFLTEAGANVYSDAGYIRGALVPSSQARTVCGTGTTIVATVVDGASYSCNLLAEATGANALRPSTATATTFTAVASGQIVKGGTVSDQWEINQFKVLSNPVVGI